MIEDPPQPDWHWTLLDEASLQLTKHGYLNQLCSCRRIEEYWVHLRVFPVTPYGEDGRRTVLEALASAEKAKEQVAPLLGPGFCIEALPTHLAICVNEEYFSRLLEPAKEESPP